MEDNFIYPAILPRSDNGGHCNLHPSIENYEDCFNCYKGWIDQKYTRAQCKRKNWVGRVDYNIVNEAKKG